MSYVLVVFVPVTLFASAPTIFIDLRRCLQLRRNFIRVVRRPKPLATLKATPELNAGKTRGRMSLSTRASQQQPSSRRAVGLIVPFVS
jgi:hypothetical protein